MTDFFLLSIRYHNSCTYFFKVLSTNQFLITQVIIRCLILEVQFLKLKMIQKFFHSNVLLKVLNMFAFSMLRRSFCISNRIFFQKIKNLFRYVKECLYNSIYDAKLKILMSHIGTKYYVYDDINDIKLKKKLSGYIYSPNIAITAIIV